MMIGKEFSAELNSTGFANLLQVTHIPFRKRIKFKIEILSESRPLISSEISGDNRQLLSKWKENEEDVLEQRISFEEVDSSVIQLTFELSKKSKVSKREDASLAFSPLFPSELFCLKANKQAEWRRAKFSKFGQAVPVKIFSILETGNVEAVIYPQISGCQTLRSSGCRFDLNESGRILLIVLLDFRESLVTRVPSGTICLAYSEDFAACLSIATNPILRNPFSVTKTNVALGVWTLFSPLLFLDDPNLFDFLTQNKEILNLEQIIAVDAKGVISAEKLLQISKVFASGESPDKFLFISEGPKKLSVSSEFLKQNKIKKINLRSKYDIAKISRKFYSVLADQRSLPKREPHLISNEDWFPQILSLAPMLSLGLVPVEITNIRPPNLEEIKAPLSICRWIATGHYASLAAHQISAVLASLFQNRVAHSKESKIEDIDVDCFIHIAEGVMTAVRDWGINARATGFKPLDSQKIWIRLSAHEKDTLTKFLPLYLNKNTQNDVLSLIASKIIPNSGTSDLILIETSDQITLQNLLALNYAGSNTIVLPFRIPNGMRESIATLMEEISEKMARIHELDRQTEVNNLINEVKDLTKRAIQSPVMDFIETTLPRQIILFPFSSSIPFEWVLQDYCPVSRIQAPHFYDLSKILCRLTYSFIAKKKFAIQVLLIKPSYRNPEIDKVLNDLVNVCSSSLRDLKQRGFDVCSELLVGEGKSLKDKVLGRLRESLFDICIFFGHSQHYEDIGTCLVMGDNSDREALICSGDFATLNFDNSVWLILSCRNAFNPGDFADIASTIFLKGGRAIVGTVLPIRASRSKKFFQHFLQETIRGVPLSTALGRSRQYLEGEVHKHAFILVGDANHRLLG